MKIASLILGYVAAIFIGWGFAKTNNPSPEESKSPAKSLQPQSKVLTSSQLLDNLIASERAKKSPEALRQELIANLEPTDDPEKAFLNYFTAVRDTLEEKFAAAQGNLIDEPEMVKLGVLFTQWFKSNPSEAIRELGGSDGTTVQNIFRSHFLWLPLKDHLEENGVQNSFSLIHEAQAVGKNSILAKLFDRIEETGNIQDFFFLKANEPDWMNNQLHAVSLGENWAFERRDEILPYIDKKYRHWTILRIAQQEGGPEALDWFLSFYLDEDTPDVIKKRLGGE